jgi:hypothetical protein
VKLIRNIGLYLGHLLTALIGTAILSTGFGLLFHPASLIGIIQKEVVVVQFDFHRGLNAIADGVNSEHGKAKPSDRERNALARRLRVLQRAI